MAPPVAAEATTPAAWSRRRFTRAGLGASGGVIMTLASQPGMACVCKSPSGSLSNGLNSRNPKSNSCSGGSTPATWASNSNWPCGSTVTFGSLFSCTSGTYAQYRDFPLKNLLIGGKTYADGTPVPASPTKDQQKLTVYDASFDANNANLGQYLAAAYLNAAAGKTPFLKVAAVQSLWNEWIQTGGAAGGYYTPQVGTRWDATHIKNYLKSTMI